jgi:hypothetical protein
MMIAGSVALSACGAVKKATEEVKKAVDSVIDIAPEFPAVTDGDGNELTEDEVYPMPENLIFGGSAKASADIPPVITSVTLQATVLPEAAYIKKVVWSVCFVNENSAWASGKTVTDYVTVTPASEYSTTATVSLLAAFGEQIKVTVSSLFDLNLTASCLVDYRARLGSSGVLNGGSNASMFFAGGVTSVSMSEIAVFKPLEPYDLVASIFLDVYYNSLFFTPSFGPGTVLPSALSITYTITPTAEFFNNLKSRGVAKSNTLESSLLNSDFVSYYSAFSIMPSYYGVVASEDYERIWAERTAIIDKVNAAVVDCVGPYDFEFIVTCRTPVDIENYLFRCRFDRTSIVFSPTGVSLSSGSIAF